MCQVFLQRLRKHSDERGVYGSSFLIAGISYGQTPAPAAARRFRRMLRKRIRNQLSIGLACGLPRGSTMRGRGRLLRLFLSVAPPFSDRHGETVSKFRILGTKITRRFATAADAPCPVLDPTAGGSVGLPLCPLLSQRTAISPSFILLISPQL